MTYLEFHNTVITGGDLLKRVQVASVSWALRMSAAPANTPNLDRKQVWGTEIFRSPKLAAIKLLWFAIASTGIPGNGSTIDDAALQNGVDNICNTYFEEAIAMPDITSILAN